MITQEKRHGEQDDRLTGGRNTKTISSASPKCTKEMASISAPDALLNGVY